MCAFRLDERITKFGFGWLIALMGSSGMAPIGKPGRLISFNVTVYQQPWGRADSLMKLISFSVVKQFSISYIRKDNWQT